MSYTLQKFGQHVLTDFLPSSKQLQNMQLLMKGEGGRCWASLISGNCFKVKPLDVLRPSKNLTYTSNILLKISSTSHWLSSLVSVSSK